MNDLIRGFSLLLSIILLSGCLSPGAFRVHTGEICKYPPEVKKGYSKAETTCLQAVRTIANQGTSKEYELNFLEFDEQGEVYLPGHKNDLIDKISDQAKTNETVFITFIHGWNHNADYDPEDGNITSFRKVLETTAANTNKKVVGLYIGWRGRTLWGKLNYVTFWGRKHTAHELGQQGSLTEVMLELERAIKVNGHPDNKMITIGHSFGGAALYSTINAVLTERFHSSVDKAGVGEKANIEGFGDAVVLLNPAFEATRYTALFNMAQKKCRAYSEFQKPRLIVLSSQGDRDVGLWFRAGQYLNSLGESYRHTSTVWCGGEDGKSDRQIRQVHADSTGVGHYVPFLTHDLVSNKETKPEKMSSSKSIDQAWWAGLSKDVSSLQLTTLTSRGISTKYNPYMNIWTDSKVIPDHNAIWTQEVLDFLNVVIEVSASDRPSS